MENTYQQCTNWQRKCHCSKCERDRRSLLALHSQCGNLFDFIDQIIFSMRIRDEEIVNLKQILLDGNKIE